MHLLKLLTFGARQPITISIKNGKLLSKHFTGDKEGYKKGYKMCIFKKPFFKDIDGEEHLQFNINTKELIYSIQSGFKYYDKKGIISLSIDHLNDKFLINSSMANASFPIQIQIIPEYCQELPLSFQNGYPIYHGVKLDTHILVNSRDLKDFSRCVKNGELAEFELKNRKFNLHIWESEGGDYHITPRFQVRNGEKLSIKFYHPFKKELRMFKSPKVSRKKKKKLQMFSKCPFIHIYARNDCPVWFCEDTDEYALGILQGMQATQE